MKICIDAGHGGHDSGAVAENGMKEKDIVLKYALELGRSFQLYGHEVFQTRTDDHFIGLNLRAERANTWGAEVFLSLHANAALNPSANGAWFIHDDKTQVGDDLGRALWKRFSAIPGVLDADPEQEVYPDKSPWVGNRDLTVVSNTKMPAVLIELGFLTNKDDLEDLLNTSVRNKIINAIVTGTEDWGRSQGIFYRPVLDEELPYRPLPYRESISPVEAWRKSVQTVVAANAGKEEAAGPFALRTLKGFMDSDEAKENLTGFKRTLIFIVIGWLEEVLSQLLGVGDR